MNNLKIENKKILDDIIEGRIEPNIYTFTTNTIPNYLKVGDTYRPVLKRLEEWRTYFPNLKPQHHEKAIIDEKIYFRDYSIHQYLEQDLGKKRLMPNDLSEGIYYSKEFFKDTETIDIKKAVKDIKDNYMNNTGKYEYYNSNDRLPQSYHYERGKRWELRPNQEEAVNNFIKAVKNGRKNLLMYAVMRFGKSFTSLCCALEIEAKLVLIVSAKADIKDEWKKAVESPGNFSDYVFLEANNLLESEAVIQEKFHEGKKAVIFLTLQDLQGDEIKEKHKEIFEKQIDLLIVDETHFGARAQSFGKILKDAGYDKSDEKNIIKFDDENIDIESAKHKIKKINANIRLHLSGTPYRILMGSEFEKEDIISFVQFPDIVKEQENWDKSNLNNDDVNEWDNPYYGFPQMIRFAFKPNKSSRAKMEELKKSGISFAFSKLFEPQSIKKDINNNNHKKFINEKEILELLQVIDGSKEDDELLGFLDYDKIKDGKMCRHMVMVLPYCASCDAMEELLSTKKGKFKNLGEYEIINISGLDASRYYKKPNDIKIKIRECEATDQKTLTLTVNRMLTGSTVEQWDTMLYFKDTSSPQEYDQAIFRLQNQYIRTLSGKNGFIKENLKPQTLLVDFDPDRLFRLQEQKSLIYNVNTDKNGNSKLKERIEEELRISPIITMNHNKIKKVTAVNILEAVSEYNNQRSVSDELLDLPIDLSILNNEDIRRVIESQAEFNSKQGLTIEPYQGDGVDFDIEEPQENKSEVKKDKNTDTPKNYTETINDAEIKKLENQIKTYYQRLLFFSFLTKDNVSSLDDILRILDKEENNRLAKNLYLEKDIIQKISECMDPFKRSSLDYKIQNISMLANDQSINPIERAMTSIKKFNRMSESEVITPVKVCDDMVNLLPEKGLRKIVSKKDKLLDIASKSGEYAVALYKRLTSELGYSHNEIKNLIYSIPTSSIAYEFTRRFYEILNINTDNIANKFNAYDLIEVKKENGKVDYKKINELLKQNKKFSEINLKDSIKEGDEKVNFGAVVGNPPYQISDGGAQASAKPIYQHFVLVGKKITTKFSCFITPTRWFAGGKGLDEFRDFMLEDKTIKELHDFLTPEDVFPNTNNRGGVCYFVSDMSETNNIVNIVTHKNNKKISEVYRPLRTNDIDIFIRDNIGIKIIDKIKNKGCICFLDKIISPRKPFGLDGDFVNRSDFKEKKTSISYPIKCYGKGQKIGFIEKRTIIKNTKWIDTWKVYTPYANNIGTELNDDNQNCFVGEPNSVCTETFLLIGTENDLTEVSANNLSFYLKTKFSRFLLSLAKISQHGTKQTYKFVPLQNFTSNSDIDWTKTIDQIDEQLFNKYDFSTEEREHIKKSIKDM